MITFRTLLLSQLVRFSEHLASEPYLLASLPPLAPPTHLSSHIHLHAISHTHQQEATRPFLPDLPRLPLKQLIRAGADRQTVSHAYIMYHTDIQTCRHADRQKGLPNTANNYNLT
jgi:hypothetical protein